MLKYFYMFILKFDYCTASGGDHLVMMGVRVLVLDTSETILKPMFLGEASFSQQF